MDVRDGVKQKCKAKAKGMGRHGEFRGAHLGRLLVFFFEQLVLDFGPKVVPFFLDVSRYPSMGISLLSRTGGDLSLSSSSCLLAGHGGFDL